MTVSTSDQIRLQLPAEAEYGRLARIAANGLALRMGFTYAEIGDLGLAVDETLILLLRPGAVPDTDGVVTVVFDPDPEAISVDARSSTVGESVWGDRSGRERFDTIVTPIVDEVEVDDDARHIRLLKRHVTD